MVVTQGLLMHLIVHPPDVQNREGGRLLVSTLFGLHPFLRGLLADGGYQGPKFEDAVPRVMAANDVQIVKCFDATRGFVLLPRRWVVERTFGWLNRCRRWAEDFENCTRTELAFLKLASIRLLT